jgi:signal transduction histidine kinase
MIVGDHNASHGTIVRQIRAIGRIVSCMSPIVGPPLKRSFRKRGGVPPAGRDLFAISVILVIVDAIAALLLIEVYLPRRRREAIARAPAQLSLLARDRQNALTGWVRERISDAELTASLLGAAPDDNAATEVLDRFLKAYGYESAFIVDPSGAVVHRRGSTETDNASAVQFAKETLAGSGTKVDFRRVRRVPKIFTACPFVRSGSGPAAVLFVSDPYDYVYPLFSTGSVASKTGETNLIGLYGEWGLALNPYESGSPPPMTVRRPIPKDYAARVLAVGEQSIRYVDRDAMPVLGVVKPIARTSWVVVAKMDEAEVLAGAVAETSRLAWLLAVASLILAMTAFVTLRSRRVRDLRVAEDRLARLFENSTTGIITFRVIFDDAGRPVDHEIVDMNPAAEQLLGVTAAAEIGKRPPDTPYLQWTADEHARNYEVALTGTSIEYESYNPVLERWYETRSFSPRYGQFAHLCTDVTERRKTDEAIRNLSARMLRVHDDARRRLARELHDTVAQSLAGVRMNLGVMKPIAAADDRAAAAVDDSITATDDAITQIRTLSYLLHPPMIDQAGLLTALRWYIDGFERRSGIATHLEIPDDLGRPSRDVETSVFRIVQESLGNIQRHAGSATARVSVERLDDHLRIEIADHGRGLPAAVRDDRDALLASGVGIAGINERVRELGGEMTIQSTDKGTTLRVMLPVERGDVQAD